MTTPVLTDEQIISIMGQHINNDNDDMRVKPKPFARAIEQAVLESPEVQALRKDAERYGVLRDSLGFNIDGPEGVGRFHVSQKREPGVAMYYYGDYLDAQIDSAMEKQP